MQKGLIGVLVLLILFLAAWNLRLSERTQVLEETLATAPKRRAPEPEPIPISPPEPIVRSEPKPAAAPVDPPVLPLSETPPVAPGTVLTFKLPAAEPDPDPGAGPRGGFLGISGQDHPGGGVLIHVVIAGSVAEKAGLRADDVILEYNGERVNTLAALTAKIRGGGEGAPVSLRVRRDGIEFYQGVQLGARIP